MVRGVHIDIQLGAFSKATFAKIKRPGQQLSKDCLYQIDEQEPMTEEDYEQSSIRDGTY